jgi:hypothetical protein
LDDLEEELFQNLFMAWWYSRVNRNRQEATSPPWSGDACFAGLVCVAKFERDDPKIGDRLQIAQQNTNRLAALTAPIWCLSPIFTRTLLFHDRNRQRMSMRREFGRNT